MKVRVGFFLMVAFLFGLLLGACGSMPPTPRTIKDVYTEVAGHCDDMGRTYDARTQTCV